MNHSVRESLRHLDIDDESEGSPLLLLSASVDTTSSKGVNNKSPCNDVETIKRVLDEIDNIALKRTNEGLNEINFSVGVCNCLFIVYMFGAYPQHLWLIYLCEGMIMLPRKFYNMWYAKPLNEALYYLDFCWIMNFTGLGIALLLSTKFLLLSDHARETFFNALLGVSCGVLMGANIILPFVACLFHDVNTMTSLFIHLMPPLVMYTFMWNSSDINTAWPNIFHLNYLDRIQFFPQSGIFVLPGLGLDSVVGCSILLYLLWWIPYVIFMLHIGIDLPNKMKQECPKWDTVFHSTMRGGTCIAIGKVFRGRSKQDSLKQMEDSNFDLLDFFIYMAFHMLSSVAAIYVIGYPCFRSQNFHLFMLIFVTCLTVTRGASRYTYYTTKMHSRALRKQFAAILNESKKSE
jgi:hypothetical protein